jgi:hypothetical protein
VTEVGDINRWQKQVSEEGGTGRCIGRVRRHIKRVGDLYNRV